MQEYDGNRQYLYDDEAGSSSFLLTDDPNLLSGSVRYSGDVERVRTRQIVDAG
jgi:hypothetical protein